MFITFEGVEGAGKSTQIRLLSQRIALAMPAKPVLVTREPGDGPFGRPLRDLVLSPPADSILSSRTELLIMLADRAQHVDNVIVPFLAHGGIVLCDRYSDSSIAYQGYGRKENTNFIAQLNQFATEGLDPNRTYLLDLDPSIGLLRQTIKNRMEGEPHDFHHAVRQGFLELALEYPDRILVINASTTVETVHNQIWEDICKLVQI